MAYMTFKYEVLRDKPSALYMLDDSSPFDDYSGYNRTGTAEGGTPSNHPSLVSGALYAPIFTRSVSGKFFSPVFIQGEESDSFTLEATIKSIQKTTGYTAQAYRENRALNPSSESSAYGMEGAGGGTTTVSASHRVTGTNATKFVWGSGSRGISIATAITGNAGLTAFSLPANKVWTLSFYVFVESGATPQFFLVDSSYASVASSITTFDFNSPAVGSWRRLRVTFNTNTVTSFRAYSIVGSASTYHIDSVLLEEGGNLNSYFDGSMPGFEWSGTANASISRSKTRSSSTINQVTSPNILVGSSAGQSGATTTYPTTGGPTGGTYTRRTYTTTTTMSAGTDLLYTANALTYGMPGKFARLGIWVRSSIAQKVRLAAQTLSSNQPVSGGSGGEGTADITLVPNTWTLLTLNKSAALASDITGLRLDVDSALSGALQFNNGDTFDAALATIVYDDAFNSTPIVPFDGTFAGVEWDGTAQSSGSYYLVSGGEQQILGNTGKNDGLVLNGTILSFVTKYLTAPEARISYDLQQNRAFTAAAVHTRDKNSLYVNGVLVGEVSLTTEQQADKFVSTDSFLYTGATDSSRAVAMNGLAIFAEALTDATLLRHFNAVKNVPDTQSIIFPYGGQEVNVSLSNADLFADQWWSTAADWNAASLFNVAVKDDRLVPQFDGSVSVPGQWLDSFALDGVEGTSVYGMSFNWNGEGALIEVSLDGNTWETVKRGVNISLIPNGFNPTDKDLQIRISFPGGIDGDTSYLDNLNAVGFKTAQATSTIGRTVTYSNAYPERDYRVNEFHDNWGVEVGPGGSVTISPYSYPETSEDESTTTTIDVPVRTLEVWIKLDDATSLVTFGTGSSNAYQNGKPVGSTLPGGEWVLVHRVLNADHLGAIVANYPGQIGQVVVYDTALTATEIEDIYAQYTNSSSLQVKDNSSIGVQDNAVGVRIYAYDWSILASG